MSDNWAMDKKKLTETDIITKFILSAIEQAGWDSMLQIRQEVKLRDGKVIVRGQLGVRKTVKSADVVLYHKPNMPLGQPWSLTDQEALDVAAYINLQVRPLDPRKGLLEGLFD